jgi:hypothetical protein
MLLIILKLVEQRGNEPVHAPDDAIHLYVQGNDRAWPE